MDHLPPISQKHYEPLFLWFFKNYNFPSINKEVGSHYVLKKFNFGEKENKETQIRKNTYQE